MRWLGGSGGGVEEGSETRVRSEIDEIHERESKGPLDLK